ncbi:MAG: HD domain-containing protein [Acidobacteriota bacterium]
MTFTVRDPIHGFIRADELETALISSRPMQRLRYVRQLGFTYLVFPGAEHSRFSHVLGAMELAGRVYDRLADSPEGRALDLPRGPDAHQRRLVRAAALLHDVGHAPFSHSAESEFEGEIDHEEMTRLLLDLPDVRDAFARYGKNSQGDELTVEEVQRLLRGGTDGQQRLLYEVISGELDVDKMDYLLRDTLYCGVRYGSYDIDRLLETLRPVEIEEESRWGLGIAEGGLHTLEALILARYYMFTQVYYNVTGKVLELHFAGWLQSEDRRWPQHAEDFLLQDDVSTMAAMRQSAAADNVHALAITERRRYGLAFETLEHLSEEEERAFDDLVADTEAEFGADQLLWVKSSKNPHKLATSGVRVLRGDGSSVLAHEASHFIGGLTRISRCRIYAPKHLSRRVREMAESRWKELVSS